LKRHVIDMVSVEARKIREYVDSGSEGQHRQKSSQGDLVTRLDGEVEESLKIQLAELLPEASFLGEESAGSTDAPFSWVVDPIDGTTNVIHGVRHAAVSVALFMGQTTIMGVVYSVFEDIVYSSIKGLGAQKGNSRVPVGTDEHIKVSTVDLLRNSLLSFGLPYDRAKSGHIFTAASQVFAACQDLRRNGSAALDLIAIANGTSEGHFEKDLRLWDVAAAALILSEAGGSVTTWADLPLDHNKSQGKFDVVASNSRVHGEVIEILNNAKG
jgi:myo-inositol-1(or 4)-monophosphatase